MCRSIKTLFNFEPPATDAEIRQAADRAQLAGMIDSLPDGLDTIVGERGVMLSGGQKQRVAIARTFLKNPPILILDEATSALDAATEARVSRAMATLMKGRTTFIIAHRLSTIRNADQILVITNGEVIERGTHGELLERGGFYARLHNSQFRGDEELTRLEEEGQIREQQLHARQEGDPIPAGDD